MERAAAGSFSFKIKLLFDCFPPTCSASTGEHCSTHTHTHSPNIDITQLILMKTYGMQLRRHIHPTANVHEAFSAK